MKMKTRSHPLGGTRTGRDRVLVIGIGYTQQIGLDPIGPPATKQERQNEHHQENKEQNLGNPRGIPREIRKAKKGSNDGDDKEHDSKAKHRETSEGVSEMRGRVACYCVPDLDTRSNTGRKFFWSLFHSKEGTIDLL